MAGSHDDLLTTPKLKGAAKMALIVKKNCLSYCLSFACQMQR
jgi:hypothetical protein